MKILVMGFTKIKYMPYANFYLDNLNTRENEVHILYWNRDLRNEDTSAYDSCILHEFNSYQEDDVSKVSKIKNFIKYRKYAKSVIKKENFDFIIVLHSLPGVLVGSLLKKKYKDRYILDYRDSTYEKFALFKKSVGNLVKSSSATFVSSDAFRRFLPEECCGKIFTSHNMLMDSIAHRDEKRVSGTYSEKIRISFWGFIRHEQINREIIKKIASDSRFELHYYGREQQIALNLKQYSRDICAQNVFFHGEYKPEDRYEFVRNTDIIHNIYEDGNMMLAMGNKYYDAAIFYIPIISMSNSYMAQTAKSANIGFEVNPYDNDFTDKLFEAYISLDKEDFYKNCDRELERVLREYNFGADLIQKLTDSSRKE